MDSYQGSIYDPVSLHKYLYANANPVTYTDPSGYSANKNLTETVVAATIAVMLASSVALHNQAMLNIFSSVRKNMTDAVMSLQCTVTVTDWKNVILGFPAHDFDTKWIVTIPMALLSWQLFEAIYATEEDTSNLPGVPAEEKEEKDKINGVPAQEQSGAKVYQNNSRNNDKYYYKNGKKKVPKGSVRKRRDVRNVKSEDFKDFIRSQGKSFKNNEWKKVMETWETPEGEKIEVHYWYNKVTGETWSH